MDVPLALNPEAQQIKHPLNAFYITELDLNCPTWSYAPVLFAVKQPLCCLPEVAAFHKLPEILTCSEMPHAIISKKLAAPTSAPSFLPPISLLLSDLLLELKKHIDFDFISKQQNWNKWLLAEHAFCYSWKTIRLMPLKCTVWLMPSLQGPRGTHIYCTFQNGAEQPEMKR